MSIRDMRWADAVRCLPGLAAAVRPSPPRNAGSTARSGMPAIGRLAARMLQLRSDPAVFWVAVLGGLASGLWGG